MLLAGEPRSVLADFRPCVVLALLFDIETGALLAFFERPEWPREATCALFCCTFGDGFMASLDFGFLLGDDIGRGPFCPENL